MVKPATKPKVSSDEQDFRKSQFSDISAIKNKNVLCTSCNKSVKELVLRGKCKAHPFLETLLCERCFEFFGDGEFSVDEDGSDKYCRWCGQGGTLFLCSTCSAGFCKKCIKRNLPRSALKEVEDDNWKCYCCNVKPLYELRAMCWAAKEMQVKENKNEGDSSRKRKSNSKTKSDDEEYSSSEEKGHVEKKRKKETESENAQKKEVKVAVKKLSEIMSDWSKLLEGAKKKTDYYRGKKVTSKIVKTVEEVKDAKEMVEEVLELVEESTRKLRKNLSEYMEAWEKVLADREGPAEQDAEPNGNTHQNDTGSPIKMETDDTNSVDKSGDANADKSNDEEDDRTSTGETKDKKTKEEDDEVEEEKEKDKEDEDSKKEDSKTAEGTESSEETNRREEGNKSEEDD